MGRQNARVLEKKLGAITSANLAQRRIGNSLHEVFSLGTFRQVFDAPGAEITLLWSAPTATAKVYVKTMAPGIVEEIPEGPLARLPSLIPASLLSRRDAAFTRRQAMHVRHLAHPADATAADIIPTSLLFWTLARLRRGFGEQAPRQAGGRGGPPGRPRMSDRRAQRSRPTQSPILQSGWYNWSPQLAPDICPITGSRGLASKPEPLHRHR